MDMKTLKERIESLDPRMHKALLDALIAHLASGFDDGNSRIEESLTSPLRPAQGACRGQTEFSSWVLEEWRRVSIPDWQRILRESIVQGDRLREEYARWMLREILLDPEYEEPER